MRLQDTTEDGVWGLCRCSDGRFVREEQSSRVESSRVESSRVQAEDTPHRKNAQRGKIDRKAEEINQSNKSHLVFATELQWSSMAKDTVERYRSAPGAAAVFGEGRSA